MSADTHARVVHYDLGVNETILCARADPEPSGLCTYTNPGPGPAIRHCLRHRRANVACLASSPSLGTGIPARCLCREESRLGFAVHRPAQSKPPRAVTACPAAMLVAAFTSALAV
jgi:hypothetical protein